MRWACPIILASSVLAEGVRILRWRTPGRRVSDCPGTNAAWRSLQRVLIFSTRSWMHAFVTRPGTGSLQGDVANLDGSGSVFSVDQLDDELTQRCSAMDIHPSGPMCGDGTSPSVVPAGHDGWLKALTNARVKPAQRSFRLRVADFEWSPGHDSLVLDFALGRGAYATSVLREIATTADAAR